MLHYAITHRVKPGLEREFERGLREFARESLQDCGTTGVHIIRPVPGTGSQEFGILRSFEDEESARRFYESDRFKAWQAEYAAYISEEPTRRTLHGLEAFFRDSSRPPPRWKMALLTKLFAPWLRKSRDSEPSPAP